MDHGNFDAGEKTPMFTSGPRQSQRSVKTPRPKACVAMAQQCGDSGNQSTPQGLLQLVGCRDPKARLAPTLAPRPIRARP